MAKKQKIRWFAKEWRKYRGYNLTQAAEILGTSTGNLSDLEKGHKRFNQDHLEEMAAAYNCDPADLIMRDPTQPGSIWSIWDQIEPQQRETVTKMVEALIKKAS